MKYLLSILFLTASLFGSAQNIHTITVDRAIKNQGTITDNRNPNVLAAGYDSTLQSFVKMHGMSALQYTQLDSTIKRLTGTNSHVVLAAGVLHSVWGGSSNTWEWIPGHGHIGFGNSVVTESNSYIRVDWSPGIDTVVSWVCGSDETYSRYGYMWGASVNEISGFIYGYRYGYTRNFYTFTGFSHNVPVSTTDGATLTYDTVNHYITVDLTAVNYGLGMSAMPIYPTIQPMNYYGDAGKSGFSLMYNGDGLTNQFDYMRFTPVDTSGNVIPKYTWQSGQGFFYGTTSRQAVNYDGEQQPASSNIWIIAVGIKN